MTIVFVVNVYVHLSLLLSLCVHTVLYRYGDKAHFTMIFFITYYIKYIMTNAD